MGVYIKGMEMPKEGSWRSIRIYPDGTIGRPIGFGDYALVEGAKAVPVPPHGGLIEEADAIETAWMILRGLGYLKEENPKLEQTVREVFATAPAIEVE